MVTKIIENLNTAEAGSIGLIWFDHVGSMDVDWLTSSLKDLQEKPVQNCNTSPAPLKDLKATATTSTSSLKVDRAATEGWLEQCGVLCGRCSCGMACGNLQIYRGSLL